MNNIFDGLTPNEDALTELLRNLMVHGEMSDLALSTLWQLAGIRTKTIEFEVTTQFSTDKTGNHSRPDVIVETKDAVVLIENKILSNTPLTANQPGSYLQYLQRNFAKKRKKSLIFLLPKDYTGIKMLNDRYIKTKSQIPMAIVFWEDYLTALGKLSVPNRIAKFLISEFIETCKRSTQINLTKIDFSRKEIISMRKTESIQIFAKVHHALQNIKAIVSAKAPNYSVLSEINSNSFLYHIKTKKKQWLLGFGIDFAHWTETGIPIMIYIPNNTFFDTAIRKLQKNNDGRWHLSEDESFYEYAYEQSLYRQQDLAEQLATLIIQECKKLTI